jgi:Septum formation
MRENRTVNRIKTLAVGLALVALTACSNAGDLVESGDQPSEASEPTGEPSKTKRDPEGAPAPEVGACRNLTLADIEPPTNDDAEVACTKPHTSVTYHVAEWPKKLADAASGVDDQRLSNYVYEACDRTWRRTVGGSLEEWNTSIVSWAWYRPTKRQFADGAHWFRCDLVAGQNTSRLEPLPRKVDGMLDGSFPDRYQACWTKVFSDKPKVDEGELTSCAHKHQQRAVGVVRIGKRNTPYPGEQKAFDRSNNRCGDLVAQWRGNPRPGDYGLQWPRRSNWKDGDRHATCWAVTRK